MEKTGGLGLRRPGLDSWLLRLICRVVEVRRQCHGEHRAARARKCLVNSDGAWPNPLISQRRKQKAGAEMTCPQAIVGGGRAGG